MVTVPGDTAVTDPEASMDAIATSALAHVPPGSVLPRAVVAPGQIGALPVTGPGSGNTVATPVAMPHVVV